MKFDPSKPVQTRDGRNARIIATDCKDDDSKFIVYLVDHCGTDLVITCDYNGDSSNGVSHYNYNDDLINIPEKHVRYINIDEDNLFGSRTEANKYSHTNRTECIRIEYEDGQFDE